MVNEYRQGIYQQSIPIQKPKLFNLPPLIMFSTRKINTFRARLYLKMAKISL
jgi:hypothetical protein